jgi:hypothetical protein
MILRRVGGSSAVAAIGFMRMVQSSNNREENMATKIPLFGIRRLTMVIFTSFVFVAQSSAEDTPSPQAVPGLAPTVTLSPMEFDQRRERLRKIKNVDRWSAPGTVVVVNLTVSECTWLGGTVTFWSDCGGTLMKCVGGNGREMCIDEIK